MHRRFAIAVLAAVRPFNLIAFNPLVHIGLQLLKAAVELLAKRHLIKLLEDSAVKALADPFVCGDLALVFVWSMFPAPSRDRIRAVVDYRNIPNHGLLRSAASARRALRRMAALCH